MDDIDSIKDILYKTGKLIYDDLGRILLLYENGDKDQALIDGKEFIGKILILGDNPVFIMMMSLLYPLPEGSNIVQ